MLKRQRLFAHGEIPISTTVVPRALANWLLVVGAGVQALS